MVLYLFLNVFCVLIIVERLAFKIRGRWDVVTPATPPPDHLKTTEIGLCRPVVFMHTMYLYKKEFQ